MTRERKVDKLLPDGRRTKSTRAENDMLIKTIANWLLQGTHETNGLGHDLVTEVMKRGKVKSQRAHDLINQAWQKIAEMGDNEIKYQKGARVMLLEQQIKEIKENPSIEATDRYNLIIRIYQEINKIHGVYAPTRADVTTKGEKITGGDNSVHITQNVSNLSFDELIKLAYGNNPQEKSKQRRDFDAKPN